MTDIVTPTDYLSRITPFGQRLLQFGITDSNVYLSRNTNTIFEAFTIGNYTSYYTNPNTGSTSPFDSPYEIRKDCIIDGLSTSYTLSGNIITVIVSPGTLICDSTLLVFPNETVLTLDTTDYETGFLAVSVHYQWLDTVAENSPKLRLIYVDYTGDIVKPDTELTWSHITGRLIINVFDFTKISNQTPTIVNMIPDPFSKPNIRECIKIKSNMYEIAPLPNIWYNIMKNVQMTKFLHIIPGNINSYIQEVQPFVGPGIYYYAKIDISSIKRKDCIVQCYINDVKIEPAGIQHVSNEEIRIWFPDYFVLNNPSPVKVIVMG